MGSRLGAWGGAPPPRALLLAPAVDRLCESLELLPTPFVGLAGQQELEAGQAEEIRRAKVEQARRGRSPS